MKIVQITTSTCGEANDMVETVYGLDEDGNIYHLSDKYNNQTGQRDGIWKKINIVESFTD